MPTPENTSPLIQQADGFARITLSEELYSASVIFRTSYALSDRCHVVLDRPREGYIVAEIRLTEASGDLDSAVAEFTNMLVDNKLRAEIAEETKAIRELIVAQAFAEVDFDEVDGPDDLN